MISIDDKGRKFMETKNYYEILGVSEQATTEEITSAKNLLAKKYHPDANVASGIDTTEQMQEILEAWRVLSNKKKRADYDRSFQKRRPVMKTFDLHKEAERPEEDSGFIPCWKAAGKLHEIIAESMELFHKKDTSSQLTQLALQALPHIFLLREAGIPERYWHPDTMNWLLFAWYKNRNFTTTYLLTLYDEHIKKDLSVVDGLKIKNRLARYERSVKKLMKY